MVVTRILSINDPQAIPAALKIIQEGGLIVFPTDTIYGLAADPFNGEAILKIYQAKERPEEKALPVLIGELSQMNDLVNSVSSHVSLIAAKYWPGALTIVLPKKPVLPIELSAYQTIGIRMPNLDFTLALLKSTGPLATTSANISGGANPTTAEDVLAQLDGRVDLILDGGSTPGPTASTVVDATTEDLKILREGPISLDVLMTLIHQA